MLIYAYIFSLIVGGLLLGASILLGSKDASTDHGGAHDTEHAPVESSSGGHGGFDSFFWLFRSIRFWTFFLAFFGLTGVVFEGFGLLDSSIAILLLSLVVGIGSGMGIVAAFRWLGSDESGAAASTADYVGRTVRVILPVTRAGTGKVRLELRGSTVDVLATTDDEEAFAAQDEAVIIEMEGVHARISRLEPERSGGT